VVELSLLEEFDDFFFGEVGEADLDVAFVLVEVKAEGEASVAFVLGGKITVSPEGRDFK
jgi:hypothetical protein